MMLFVAAPLSYQVGMPMTAQPRVQPMMRFAPQPWSPDDMNGCGGASQFASLSGGGSGSDQTKWANGGQWTQRYMQPPAEPQAVEAAPTETVWSPDDMNGCGGASPF